MNATTQLLINPILGLLPKFTDEKLGCFLSENQKYQMLIANDKVRNFSVSLACLLYKIELAPKDRKLFWKSLRGNSKLLEAASVSKKEFPFEIMEMVNEALKAKKYVL